MNKLLLLASLGTLLSFGAVAQEDIDLFELSLEELMNVEIVSASKKEESAFDAPVSSSVITRDEIARSGVTTIPEALRLSPGLIVRETTNGNYDVFIRGFDNLHRYGSSTEQHNLYTLVMIDNRPVFNYNLGGTYWESLPIDLVDIERIEIVRGPSAPLFGPNAVTGVINIITHRPKKQELHLSSYLQYGTPHSVVAGATTGGQIGDRWNVHLSGNYQDRKRHDDQYYVYDTDQFLESPDPRGIVTMGEAYPDTELAMEKYGLNAWAGYQANDQVSVEIAAGWQEATAQRFNYAARMPLSFNHNHSGYVNVAGEFYGVGTKVSYSRGYDNIIPGSAYAGEYDFDIMDVVIDYQWKVTDKLSLRPALNYQSASYDDTKYIGASLLGGFFNGSPSISNIAGSLRSDYLITDQWRLIGALRVDKFSRPDDTYLSYQFASTYKLNDQYLLRAVHSRSNSGAFINNFINVNLPRPIEGTDLITTNRLTGNPDLKLATVTMTEVGFRGQITKNFQVDLELFRQHISNIFSVATTNLTFQPTGFPAPNDVAPELIQQNYVNLPLTAVQSGVTLSANYVPDARFQIRPFVTFQKTDVENIPLAFSTLPAAFGLGTLSDAFDDKNESTPRVFGGVHANAAFTARWNANINAYFFGKQTMYTAHDLARETTINDIDSKFLVNAKLSYRLVDKLRVFGTVKNALGNNSREHYGTDRIGRSFFGGISYNF